MAELKEYRFRTDVFLIEVRKRQHQLGRALCGCSKLSPEELDLIQKTTTDVFNTTDTHGLTYDSGVLLLKRQVELCRRQKMPLPSVAYASALRHLISEAAINAEALEEDINKLVPVTIYRGAIGPQLVQRFPELAKSRGTLRHAVAKNPFNPAGLCERVEQTIGYLTQLCNDPTSELYMFRKTPWITKHIAIHNPSDPLKAYKALRHRICTFIENSKKPDDEFHCFEGTEGIFKYAGVHHMKDMAKFLRNAKKTYTYLVEESKKPLSELYCLAKKKGVLRTAAIGYPNKAMQFLRDVIQGRVTSSGEPIRPVTIVETKVQALKKKTSAFKGKVETSVGKVSNGIDAFSEALGSATKTIGGFGNKTPGGFNL